MINSGKHPSASKIESSSSEYCANCKAPLFRGLYFCQNCATPHRPLEEVLPPVSLPILTDSQRIRLLSPKSYSVFWAYLSLILGTGVVGTILFQDITLVSIFFSIVFTIFTGCYAAIHFPALKPQLTRFGFGNPAVWIGLAILAPLLGINYLYHVVFLESLASGITEEDNYLEIFSSLGGAVFFVAVIPAITEEISYRGLIQHWLHEALVPYKAIGLAAFLFSISHFSVISFPYLFAVGFLLGWLRWKSGSLYPGILAHFLHNFVVLLWN